MNESAFSLYELFARKLAAHPELLRVARENCRRWLSQGHSAPNRLREWDVLLAAAETNAAGMARLQSVLAGTDESKGRLREFHPLAGILTREERRLAKELCGYRH
jgi:hypothetical protein